MTVMHPNVILSLTGSKAATAEQGKEGRSRLGKQHQALSASFLSALAAKLAELAAPRTARQRLGGLGGSELQRSQEGLAGKDLPDATSDDSACVASAPAIAEESDRPAAHRARGLASHIRTAQRRYSAERGVIAKHNGQSNKTPSSSSEKTEAQPGAIPKSSNTVLKLDRTEARGAIQNTTKESRFGAMRRAAYPYGRSLHFNSNTFRKASVGIRRLVPTNKGLTQPHFRSSESRQDSYLPAKSSAARRRLPSKASRFWGRSESHHPSFRALGLQRESDNLTSGLKSSGRLPSPSKSLGAKLKLVAKGTTGEIASRKPTLEGAKSQARHHILESKASGRAAGETSAGLTGRKPKPNSVRGSHQRTHARPSRRVRSEDGSGASRPSRRGGKTVSQEARLGEKMPPAELQPETSRDGNLRQTGYEADGTSGSRTALRAEQVKVPSFKGASGAEGTDESRKAQNVSRKGAIAARFGGGLRGEQVNAKQAIIQDDFKKPVRMERSSSFSPPAGRSTSSQPQPTAEYMRSAEVSAAKPQVKQRDLQVKQQEQVGASKRSARLAAKIGVVATERSEDESPTRAPTRTESTSQPERRSALATREAPEGSEPRLKGPGSSSSDGSGLRRASAHEAQGAGTHTSKKVRGARGDLRPEMAEVKRSASAEVDKAEVKQARLTVKREVASPLTNERDRAPKTGQRSAEPAAQSRRVQPSSRASAATSKRNGVEGARRPAVSVEPGAAANADAGNRPGVTSVSRAPAKSGVSSAPEAEPARMAMRSAPERDRVAELEPREEHAASRDTKENGKSSLADLSRRADTGPDKNAPEAKPVQMGRGDSAQRMHQGKPSEPVNAPDRGSNGQSVDAPDGSARLFEGSGHHYVENPRAALKPSTASELQDSRSAARDIDGAAKTASTHQWQEAFANVAPESRAGGFMLGSQSVLAGHQGMMFHVAGQIRKLCRSGKQEMQIRLRPPELGGMKIKVEITNDVVKATLVVDQPQTHALLEKNMSQLFRALQEQGLKVDTLSVEIGSGSEEFGPGSQSEDYNDGQGHGASHPSEPWRDVVPDTMLAAGLVSGSRLLDVMA